MDPLELVRTQCVAQPEPPGLLCAPGGIADMGLAVLGLQEALEKAELEVRYARDRSQVAEGVYAYSLRAWHRQWWLVLPLGVLAGIAITTTVQLALGH